MCKINNFFLSFRCAKRALQASAVLAPPAAEALFCHCSSTHTHGCAPTVNASSPSLERARTKAGGHCIASTN